MFWFQETKPAGADNDHINLRVIGQNNSEVHFRIKKTTQMKKLKAAFCERQVIILKLLAQVLLSHIVLKGLKKSTDMSKYYLSVLTDYF